MINANWCLADNVGDKLTPWIIKKITGYYPIYAEGGAYYDHYVLTGSILNHTSRNSIVWGAGLANITDGVNNEARLCAVRGPMSHQRAWTCGNRSMPAYGDTGLLAAKWYQPPQDKKYEMGIVPHYVDQFRIANRYGKVKGVRILNVFDTVEKFIDDLVSCKKIVSSSLHGLVLAEAYRIPNLWAKFSDSILGDNTKYYDHLLSVGLKLRDPIDHRDIGGQPVGYWDKHEFLLGNPNFEALDKACPL